MHSPTPREAVKSFRDFAPHWTGAGQTSLSFATDQKSIALKGLKRYCQGVPQRERGRSPPALFQASGLREAPRSSLENVATKSQRVRNCGQTSRLPCTTPPQGPPQASSRLGTGWEGEGNLAPTTSSTAPAKVPDPAHPIHGLRYPTLTEKRGRVLVPARPQEFGVSPRVLGEAAAGTPSPPPPFRCGWALGLTGPRLTGPTRSRRNG